MAIESGELKLGSSEANQPVILGDTFMPELEGILDTLKQLANALSTEPALKVAPSIATQLVETINAFEDKKDSYKSKVVKVL